MRFTPAVALLVLFGGCPAPEEPRDVGMAIDVPGDLDAPTVNDTPSVDVASDAPDGSSADGGAGSNAPVTADEAARFLAVASACPGTAQSGLSDGRIAGVIDRSRDHAGFAEMVRCVGAAGTDCGAVLGCGLQAGVVDGVCDRTRCEGDLLRLCIGLPPGTPDSRATIDCSVLGLTCVTGDSGAVGCGAPCTESACDPSGRSGIWCASGIGTLITCNDGLRCTTTGLAPIDCVGDGAACTADTCSGATLTDCDPVSSRGRPPVDCADVGGTCDVALGCVPSATECTPGAGTCDGSVITYCSPSRTEETLDCTALGFSRCLAATGSGVYCLE